MRKDKIINRIYSGNKKEWRAKFKINISIHNELSRLFIQKEQLDRGIRELLCMFVRCEVMGAAEACCEGEVHEGHIRLTKRYALRSYLFGKEHTINQLSRVLSEELDEIMHDAAVAAYKEFGEPLYARDDRRAHKRAYPSVALKALLRKPIQLDLVEGEWDESSDDD